MKFSQKYTSAFNLINSVKQGNKEDMLNMIREATKLASIKPSQQVAIGEALFVALTYHIEHIDYGSCGVIGNSHKNPDTQEWISVNHLLPEYNVNVLVIGEQKGMNPQMGGGYISIAMRKDLRKTILFKEKEKYQCENGFGMMNYVTHWMPLPEKP